MKASSKPKIFTFLKFIWILIPICFVGFWVIRGFLPDPTDIEVTTSEKYLESGFGNKKVIVTIDSHKIPVSEMKVTVDKWDMPDETYTLTDDGYDGDEKEGDGIYTFVMEIDTDQIQSEYNFWVTAKFGGFYYGDYSGDSGSVKVMNPGRFKGQLIEDDLTEYGGSDDYRKGNIQKRVDGITQILDSCVTKRIIPRNSYYYDSSEKLIYVSIDDNTKMKISMSGDLSVMTYKSDSLI